MSIGKRIREQRLKRNMTLEELGKRCKTSRQTIYKYEQGKITNIPMDRLEAISSALMVPLSYLMGWDGEQNLLPDNIIPIPKTKRVPLIGRIACGVPILAEENYEDEVEMPENVKADFALRCNGDSMINARIFDGDVVYIKKQSIVNNGEIAAVLIGEEATLKRVMIYEDHIALIAENPTYKPILYWNSDMNNVSIIGKAVAFTSVVR